MRTFLLALGMAVFLFGVLVLALVSFTTAMAAPTHDVRIPRNRAVVMLVIDVSQSMRATDVAPSRLLASSPGSVTTTSPG